MQGFFGGGFYVVFPIHPHQTSDVRSRTPNWHIQTIFNHDSFQIRFRIERVLQMKIAIIGLGCVAMADALALARTHEVVMTGPLPDRVDDINRGIYGLNDPELAPYLAKYPLNLRAVLDTRAALANADMVFVAAPLSTQPETGDVRLVELDSRIEFAARCDAHAPIVVRSAVPIGYCEEKRAQLKGAKIVYAPEFSRDGHMLSDILYPNALIVGDRHALGKRVLDVLKTAALRADIPTRQMGLTEAELTRHLSTLFQATRVTCFNELDSYAMQHGLNARQIIDGVSLDPRIGAYANNPCFGYDRQTLPHGANMLSAHLDQARTPLLANLGKAGCARVAFLTGQIIQQAPAAVGFYMPDTSPPLSASIAQLKLRLEDSGIRTCLHDGDPATLGQFKAECEIVISQRARAELADIQDKVFTRDHFARPQEIAG
jgi:UDPglucose 6-dehydrogenase